MLVSVVPMGDFFGIKIPDKIMKRLHITDQVELEVHDRDILMKPVDAWVKDSPERIYKEEPENDWQ
jgi:antitoxin component of MazEF toxin-antitoxin module